MLRMLLLACLLPLASCAPAPVTTAPGTHTLTIHATVPEGLAGTVYVSGNLDSLGPWNPAALALDGAGRERTVALEIPHDHAFEFKFTLGSWDREALGPSGMVMPNNRLLVDRDQEFRIDIGDFKKDPAAYIADWQGSGVRGTLVYWSDVKSKFLEHPRHVEVWLPPGYADDPQRRYRVIYMSDGQNLFDPRIANTGTDWGVDEAMVALAAEGIEPAIVVGAWSSPSRGAEYSPWHGAPDYARFLIEELKPRVDAEFRTRSGPRDTFHMGSSMGGLLSFYLVTRHPQTFGGCGCVSTHFPLSEAIVAQYFAGVQAPADPDPTPYIVRDIEAGLKVPPGARLWFDHGTVGLDAQYAPTHAAVRDWLLGQGLREGRDFVVRAYPGADHNEASWRARLVDPLRFLLAP